MLVRYEAGQGPTDKVRLVIRSGRRGKGAAAAHPHVNRRLSECALVAIGFGQEQKRVVIGFGEAEGKLFCLHRGKSQLSRPQGVVGHPSHLLFCACLKAGRRTGLQGRNARFQADIGTVDEKFDHSDLLIVVLADDDGPKAKARTGAEWVGDFGDRFGQRLDAGFYGGHDVFEGVSPDQDIDVTNQKVKLMGVVILQFGTVKEA
ncbi:MAG TPA: hypothetical protein DDZ58_07975 [Achromobacter sp.]|nr:hypothetical protein [Achromobacter sp.]